MKWNSSLAIGIEAIDNQHKQIFEHLLALENSVAKRDPWHIVRFLLSQLAEYMKFHLAVEEAMLEIVRFLQQRDHCQAHAKIMDQIADLEKHLQRAGSETNLVGFFEDGSSAMSLVTTGSTPTMSRRSFRRSWARPGRNPVAPGNAGSDRGSRRSRSWAAPDRSPRLLKRCLAQAGDVV